MSLTVGCGMKAKVVAFALALKAVGFNIYVAVNMLLCSIIFVGQSYPRETLSGFIGRRALSGSSFFLYLAQAIDKLYRNEPAHCGETALAEDNMRCELYPEIQEAQLANLPDAQEHA